MLQGCCSVGALTLWGFGCSPVVMANEAHSGLARCIRIREVGVRVIQAAHQAGVRRLAMEALPRLAGGPARPVRDIPPSTAGYLVQPDMRRLITTALELGGACGRTKQSSTLAKTRRTCSPGNSPTGANASRPAICASCRPLRPTGADDHRHHR